MDASVFAGEFHQAGPISPVVDQNVVASCALVTAGAVPLSWTRREVPCMPWTAATRPRPDRRLSSVFLAPHLVPTKMVRDLRHRRAAEAERERGNKPMPMAGSTARHQAAIIL
jgi:hypothetical protein